MTKTNEKIHVLADESLGGIKREYVEVDRKAEVGDRVVLPGEGNSAEYVVEVRGFEGDYKLDSGFYVLQEYVNTLQPTDIVHIDGPDGTERYELTDRKAEEGDKILTTQTQFGRLPVGKVLTVTDVFDDASVGELGVGIVEKTDYRVLVPVESSEEEPQPSDPIDVIANLATRVAELERENKRIQKELGWYEVGAGSIANLRNSVSDIRHDIAKLEDRIVHDYATNEDVTDFLYEEVKRLQDEIDTLHKDNRRHGEELAKIKDRIDDFQDAENDRIYNLYAITNGKKAPVETEESPPIDAPLVFICRKPGRFEVYQDGKKLCGVMSVRINAKVGEFATHEIEYISGATEEERQ
ncbi:hypothetical protein FKN04_24585 [Bacillus glycinifermentans]|uniref:hypothetical protein n=1 Tax=Bacillus glycinifermentans TaxID=1664069 RepID=UPI0015836654|nr:hypothetical protein [Bacillus glycinifermentans]NUJ19706.1 hypothetical protein [Bacillus glycinifermentans]